MPPMKESLSHLPQRKRGELARIVSIIRDLLKRAYVEARYNPKYIITAEELKYLARCVELLRDQTETSCEKKMESFVQPRSRI